jgi:hypothetical protein
MTKIYKAILYENRALNFIWPSSAKDRLIRVNIATLFDHLM